MPCFSLTFHFLFTDPIFILFFFFFNDTATTEIYTLSLHDALPIRQRCGRSPGGTRGGRRWCRDRKSTRLNSSHVKVSYAVFCLKKKKKKTELRSREKNERRNILEKKKK